MTLATAGQRFNMPPGMMQVEPTSAERVGVGLRLRRARKDAGYSLPQASELSGLSRSTIGSIERGEHDISSLSARNLMNLHKAFGLTQTKFAAIVTPVYGSLGFSDDDLTFKSNNPELTGSSYINVRIMLVKSGKTSPVSSPTIHQTSVPVALTQRSLGGLLIDREYVQGVPIGSWALWSDAPASVGDLIVVSVDGWQYPAFLLPDGLVETDHPISPIHPLRFKPDQIIGKVEEVRLLELPRRN